MNIKNNQLQRARDHGLPSYVQYRKFCNMSDVKTFDDLEKEISSKEVKKILQELYGDVRNIDLWPGNKTLIFTLLC